MKRIIPIILCLTLLLGLSAEAFTTVAEPIVITPEVFTERFNAFMKAYFETSGMTPVPAKLILGEEGADGALQFSLNIQNGLVIGKAKNEIVQEVELSVDDPMGFAMLIAGMIAVSDIPNPADGMDLSVMDAHIPADPKNDDISYSNGYQAEITERFEGTVATKLLITRLP
ncbi:MAG TPA: hypothetical protein GXZ91_06000 [Christensenellaceae bacterium]|jgi:hypothetical protein|nr:hypothetical protein [Christensenellaceae bacterium]